MTLRQANEAVASERSIFSENQDYKRFFPLIAVNPYGPIISGSRCAWWYIENYEQTHTHGTTIVTLAAHARRVN